MVCKLNSFEVFGISARLIKVEVDINRGLPAIYIVGLADRALQEARLRVASAIKNSGYKFPQQRIVINLAPAYLYKSGTTLDLVIALGILITSRQIKIIKKYQNFQNTVFWGELALDGRVEKGIGSLPIVSAAKQNGFENVFLSNINASEAGNLAGINTFGIDNLNELINILEGKTEPVRYLSKMQYPKRMNISDFNDIKGQFIAKRALEIAAAGRHNIILSGAQGVGKTILCSALQGIVPRLNEIEMLEVAQTYSAVGENYIDKYGNYCPFQRPHHTTSLAALFGSGYRMKPGIIALANKGILFFDECNLFNIKALEALREPLEEKVLRVNKYRNYYEFPSDFMFVAAINPCPCGNYGSSTRQCKCPLSQIEHYKNRIPKPILNRIDMQVNINANQEFIGNMQQKSESSTVILKRVAAARDKQLQRGLINNCLNLKELNKFAKLRGRALATMHLAVEKLQLSERGQIRLWRVARTIADLANDTEVNEKYLKEAICYRIKDA